MECLCKMKTLPHGFQFILFLQFCTRWGLAGIVTAPPTPTGKVTAKSSAAVQGPESFVAFLRQMETSRSLFSVLWRGVLRSRLPLSRILRILSAFRSTSDPCRVSSPPTAQTEGRSHPLIHPQCHERRVVRASSTASFFRASGRFSKTSCFIRLPQTFPPFPFFLDPGDSQSITPV